MQKNTKSNNKIFSRKIELYSLIGWFNKEEYQETQEFLKILLDIIKLHQKISPKQIENIYGLDEGIASNLLTSICEVYPNLLSYENSSNGHYFSINETYSLDDFKSIIEKKEIRLSFGLCLKPLFIVKQFIKSRNEFKLSNNDEQLKIIDSLNKIIKNSIDDTEDYSTRFSEDMRIIPEKGVFIQGKTNGKIVLNEKNDFDVYINDILCSNIVISDSNPDYQKITKELDDLRNNIENIQIQIDSMLKKELGSIQFDYYINIDEGSITVNINEDRKRYFGKIIKFSRAFESEIFILELNENWIMELKIEIEINNSDFQNKALFFNVLAVDIAKKRDIILTKNNKEILNYANDLWKSTLNVSNNEWNEKNFLNYLEIIHKEDFAVIFNFILGKFKEEEIFV